MKKHYVIAAFILVSLFWGGQNAFAATACPNGTDDECPDTQVCNPDTKMCIAPDAATGDSTSGIGGACTNDDQCRGNSVECSAATHTCQYSTNTSTGIPSTGTTGTGASTASTPTAGAATSNTPSGNFVALTQIPAIQDIATNSATLTAFFNNLYKYCVGIAAVLAVFMIIWAGVTWMGAGDNTEKISQARKRITDALFGLVLVLSPMIVFSIINPNVLNLSLNFGSLAPTNTGSAAVTTTPTTNPTTTTGATTMASSCNTYSMFAPTTGGSCTAPLTQIDASCCALGPGQICCGSK